MFEEITETNEYIQLVEDLQSNETDLLQFLRSLSDKRVYGDDQFGKACKNLILGWFKNDRDVLIKQFFEALRRMPRFTKFKDAFQELNENEFIERLNRAWFYHCKLNGAKPCSFQHYFLGELRHEQWKHEQLRGLHNWTILQQFCKYAIPPFNVNVIAGHENQDTLRELSLSYGRISKICSSVYFGLPFDYEFLLIGCCALLSGTAKLYMTDRSTYLRLMAPGNVIRTAHFSKPAHPISENG